jgi:Fe2+ transport system protein FeoA
MTHDEHRVPLSSLSPGDAGIVTEITGEGAFRRRLLDMGFVEGAPVRVIKTAPLQDPIEYCIGGTHITLRKSEASLVLVTPAPHLRRYGPGPGRGMGRGHGPHRGLGWRRWRKD